MNNHPHSITQTDLPLDVQILNISVNMARIGNWISNLDTLKVDQGTAVYKSRLELIKKIINQIIPKSHLLWAEKALTWANILEHRAKLA